MLAEDGAESLIAAPESFGRLTEEVFAQSVIHGWTSRSVTALWRSVPRIGMFSVGMVGKEQNTGWSRKKPFQGLERANASRDPSPRLDAKSCRQRREATKYDDSRGAENAEFLRVVEARARKLSSNYVPRKSALNGDAVVQVWQRGLQVDRALHGEANRELVLLAARVGGQDGCAQGVGAGVGQGSDGQADLRGQPAIFQLFQSRAEAGGRRGASIPGSATALATGGRAT